MSGIEVVGLVLGVIPIVVEAFKQYEAIRKACNNAKRKARARHLRILVSTLKTHHTFIKLDVNRVLENAGVIEKQSQCLEPKEVLDLLKDVKVQKAVQKYLDIVYGDYLQVLQDCQAVLLDIATSFEGLLPVNKHGSPENGASFLRELLQANASLEGPPIWNFGGRKLKFLMEKDAIDEKMKLLEKYSAILERLHRSVPSTEVLHDTSPSPKTVARLTKFYSKVHDHARDLYNGLCSQIPPASGCHHLHSVRLFLEPRIDFLVKPKLSKCCVSFDIEVAGFKPPGIPDAWHRGAVTLIETEASHDDLQPNRSKVRFSVSIPRSISSSCAELKQLDKLCKVIHEARTSGHTVRLHLSKNGTLSFTKKKDEGIPESRPLEPRHIRLKEILERAHKNGPEKRWSLNQRMHLAFKAASSVLQLNRTPWLVNSCTADSIYFLETQMEGLSLSKSSRRPLPFDANHPFLTKSGAPGLPGATCGDPTAESWMLDFAILLLEIWERKTFHQWAGENGKCAKGPHTYKLELAREWWAEIHEDISDYYKFALSRCLEGASLSTHSWDDNSFQCRFCSDVVVPLWENCKDLNL